MRILVDADACPVKDEIIRVAKKEKLEVLYFVDVNHQLKSDYAEIFVVDQGADSVDLALINQMKAEDIVVSQDYGVASLAIGKRGYVILPSGKELDQFNIDMHMFERHISREERKKRGRRGSRHKKRTAADNESFETSLEYMVTKYR